MTNREWAIVHKEAPLNSQISIETEQKVREYFERKLKNYSETMIEFGQLSEIEEIKSIKTSIREKKEYSFEDYPIFSESELLKIKHLSKRPSERFESYEEFCNKRAFWESK